jgi:cytochrome c
MLLFVPGGPAWARLADGIGQGRQLVEVNCGNCHAWAKPMPARTRLLRLSANCRTVFRWTRWRKLSPTAGSIRVIPDMPEFIATPEQVDAIIAYIASLQD